MKWTHTRQLTALLGAMAIGIGCGEQAGPIAPAPGDAAPASLAFARRAKGPETVTVLERLQPVRGDHRATMTIGPEGGEIAIPEAGFRMLVPPGALATPASITVHALRGSAVAYEFGPHGLNFLAPVLIVQDLRETMAARDPWIRRSLSAGYFEDANTAFDPIDGSATITERRRVRVTLDLEAVIFEIVHFSGYLVATG